MRLASSTQTILVYSQVEGSDRWWRGAVSGGKQALTRRWRGEIAVGGQQTQVEGRDRRWRGTFSSGGVITRVTDITNTIEAYSPRFRTKVLNAWVKHNLSFRIKVGIALPPSEEEILTPHGRGNLNSTRAPNYLLVG